MSIKDILGDVSSINQQISNAIGASQPASDGFVANPIPGASGNGLPSSQIPNFRQGKSNRKLINWFVPEVGIIQMYINPNQIQYNEQKLITKERTKGGYNLQYWGEELTSLNINGTTGSSGIEGINVLYEIYRSEQFVFDNIGLSISAVNTGNAISNLISEKLSGNVFGELTAGVLGVNQASQINIPNNLPSLASLAFSVEMYYDGWVYRGYFSSFSFTESADNFSFNYQIGFIPTQRRGYRVNGMPWQNSPITGGSNWGSNQPSFGNYPEYIKPSEASVSQNPNLDSPPLATNGGVIIPRRG